MEHQLFDVLQPQISDKEVLLNPSRANGSYINTQSGSYKNRRMHVTFPHLP